MAETDVLTVNEVAERLRIHPRTAYRLLNEGAIPSIRVGRQFRVSARVLDEYIRGERPPSTATAPPSAAAAGGRRRKAS